MAKQTNKWKGAGRAVLLVWIPVIGLLAFEWIQYAAGASQRPVQFEQAVTRVQELEQKAKDKPVDNSKQIETLTAKSLFAPQPPKPKIPQCAAILGDTALINGQWYTVGQEVAGAKLLSLDATSVTLLWEGNEVKQYPFGSAGSGSSGPRGSRPKRVSRRSRPDGSGQMPLGPPMRFGGPGAFFGNMSLEERQRMRERYQQMSPEEREAFRQEMRQRYESRREN